MFALTVDLVIKNCRLATSSSLFEAGIACDEGKIVQIATDSFLPKADKTVDGKGNLVLPGVIDAHVHMRAPGATSYKEDWKTGSAAAACGGVTTMFEMPTSSDRSREVKNVDVFRGKLEVASKDSIVDFGLYALVSPGNFNDLPLLADAGVIGFKVFLSPSATKSELLSDSEVLEAFAVLSKLGLRTEVHAENASLLEANERKMRASERTDILAHLEIRNSLSEAEAVGRIVMFAQATRAKIQIAHLSCKESVDIVARAKAEGAPVSAETTPHYLLLNNEDYGRIGSAIKVNPPVRTLADSSRLWQGLVDGTIDCVVTDHAPHTREEKITSSVWDTSSGITGIETSVPLILTQVNAGRITINRYVQVSSENPARLFGVYPRKGALLVGSDCDLTVVDMKKEGRIRSDRLHSKNKVTPFEGFAVKGIPVMTVVRGQVVMEDGEPVTGQNGVLVKPSK